MSKEAETEKEIASFLEELRTAEDLLSETVRNMQNCLDDFEFDEDDSFDHTDLFSDSAKISNTGNARKVTVASTANCLLQPSHT